MLSLMFWSSCYLVSTIEIGEGMVWVPLVLEDGEINLRNCLGIRSHQLVKVKMANNLILSVSADFLQTFWLDKPFHFFRGTLQH